MKGTITLLRSVRAEEKEKRLLSLCEEYDIMEVAPSLLLLFCRAEEATESKVEHFKDVISMCDALLALRRNVSYFAMTLGSKQVEFGSSGSVPGIIEECLNNELLNECSMGYNDTDTDNLGLIDNMFMGEENALFEIYKAHTEIDQAQLERMVLIDKYMLDEVNEGIALLDSLGEKDLASKLLDDFKSQLSRDTQQIYSLLENEEIKLIKSTYKKYLDIETKAEGNKKAEGFNTKNAKLGRLAWKVMEKLPNDMGHKHLFIADFLKASGALDFRRDGWIEDFFDEHNKTDEEREHQVRLWMKEYDRFREKDIEK